MEGAVASLFDANEIRIQASAARSGDSWRLQVKINPADLLMENGEGDLELSMVLIFKDGRRSVSDPFPVRANVSPGQTEILTGGQHKFPADVQKVRLIARGVRSGAIGSKTIGLSQ